MGYHVTVIVDGEDVVSKCHSQHGMHRTLCLAAEMLRGIPCAEVCIRRDGHAGFRSSCKMAAWMHSNWRGELDEVEVYSPISPVVAPINPQWSAFKDPWRPA